MSEDDDDSDDALAAFVPDPVLLRRLLQRRDRPGMADLNAARPAWRSAGVGLGQFPLSSSLAARGRSDNTLAVAPGQLPLPSLGEETSSADVVAPGGGGGAAPLAVAPGSFASDATSPAAPPAALVKLRAEVSALQATLARADAKRAIAAKKSPPKSWQSRKEDDTLPGLGAALFGSFGQPTLPTSAAALFGVAPGADEVMPLVAAAAQAEPSQVSWSDEPTDPVDQNGPATAAGAGSGAPAKLSSEPASAASATAASPATAARRSADQSAARDDDGKATPEGSMPTRHLAESVSRNLYRRLQLERERRGIAAWKN